MEKVITRIDRTITTILRVAMALGMGFVLCGLLFQVISRYVLGTALFGTDELVMIAATWCFFLGLSHGARTNSIVKGEMIQMIVKGPRARRGIDALCLVLSCAVSLIFLKWSWDMVTWTVQSGERTPVFGFSQLVFQAPIVLGFALTSTYFAARFVLSVTGATQREEVRP